MSRIAEIRKLSRGRFLICLEDAEQFPLYQKEIAAYDLKEGQELSKEASNEIFKELLPKRCRARAMHLLEQMDRTEYQLREKLRQSYYPAPIIDDAIEYVKGYHYIDDFRYAGMYLKDYASSKSMRQMKQELYKKGIAKEIVEQAAVEAEADEDFPDEETQIRNLLEKKHYDPATKDRKEQQRIYAFLARRGFDASAIRHVIKVLEKEEESF